MHAPKAAGARQLADRPTDASSAHAAKRQRAAVECVAELRELKAFLDGGALAQAEFCDLKARILDGT